MLSHQLPLLNCPLLSGSARPLWIIGRHRFWPCGGSIWGIQHRWFRPRDWHRHVDGRSRISSRIKFWSVPHHHRHLSSGARPRPSRLAPPNRSRLQFWFWNWSHRCAECGVWRMQPQRAMAHGAPQSRLSKSGQCPSRLTCSPPVSRRLRHSQRRYLCGASGKGHRRWVHFHVCPIYAFIALLAQIQHMFSAPAGSVCVASSCCSCGGARGQPRTGSRYTLFRRAAWSTKRTPAWSPHRCHAWVVHTEPSGGCSGGSCSSRHDFIFHHASFWGGGVVGGNAGRAPASMFPIPLPTCRRICQPCCKRGTPSSRICRSAGANPLIFRASQV